MKNMFECVSKKKDSCKCAIRKYKRCGKNIVRKNHSMKQKHKAKNFEKIYLNTKENSAEKQNQRAKQCAEQ